MQDSPAEVQTASQMPHVSKKRIVFWIILVGALLYIGLNVGIWTYSRNSSKSGIMNQTVFSQKSIALPQEDQTLQSMSSLPTSTPTPRLTGPGQYACSPIGTCKNYSDAIRKEKCTVTYADNNCLDQCGDTTKQCKN